MYSTRETKKKFRKNFQKSKTANVNWFEEEKPKLFDNEAENQSSRLPTITIVAGDIVLRIIS